jgi:acetyl-CoA carboxylase biotin carboxyl carrier protein
MELKQIKELMAAMGRTGMKRLALKKEGFELQLEREQDGHFRGLEQGLEISEEPLPQGETLQRRANVALSRTTTNLGHAAIAEAPKEDTISNFVTSPMVGTFYASPSPDDPSFVKLGDKIDKNSVVCIIEAMKVMNEIKAGIEGTVVEMLVESGHPVEFGTKLFRIT